MRHSPEPYHTNERQCVKVQVMLSKKAKSETSRFESELVEAGRSVSVRVDPSQQ